MALVFRSLHAASKPELLNEEWFELENTGPGDFSSGGCSLLVGRPGQRPRVLGPMQPGFTLHAGEKIRLVTGTPGKKALGTPPEGGKNYFLMLREPVLARSGVTVTLALNQVDLAHIAYEGAPKA